jgi:hypothetical protein
MRITEAVATIEREPGSHFDPAIVDLYSAISRMHSHSVAEADGRPAGTERREALAVRSILVTESYDVLPGNERRSELWWVAVTHACGDPRSSLPNS